MLINMYEVYDCLVTEEQLNLFDQLRCEGIDKLTNRRSNARRYGHTQKSVDLAVAYELYKIYLKQEEI